MSVALSRDASGQLVVDRLEFHFSLVSLGIPSWHFKRAQSSKLKEKAVNTVVEILIDRKEGNEPGDASSTKASIASLLPAPTRRVRDGYT
ncbi:hypothetical protein BaRGS_00007731, partial [Batillaria attramentaria]